MARVVRLPKDFILRLIALLTGVWLLSYLAGLMLPEARVQLTAPDEVDLYAINDSTLAEVQTPAGKVQLKRALFCLDVQDRKPVLIKSAFKRNVDYFYCYSVISAPTDSIAVVHRWIVDGQPDFERRLIVRGKNCRVWSRRHILCKKAGQGRVDIVLDNGNILGTAVFKLL